MLSESEICNRYLSGTSMQALARDVGRSQCYIDGVLKRGGIKKRSQGRPGGTPRPDRQIPEAVKAQIVDLYESGFSSPKISLIVGVSKQTVLRTLKMKGINRRTQKVDIGREAEELYAAGMSCIQVAAKLSVSKRSVLRYLSARGVKRRSQAEENVTEIVSAYQSGMTARDVADQFGVSSGHVFSMLRKSGARTRRTIKKGIEIDIAQASTMYARGMTPEQIGKYFGASRSTILNRLTSAGIKIRKHVHSYKYTSEVVGVVELKGTWELSYAKVLDERVSAGGIARWEYEPDKIKLSNGKIYIPDFKIYHLDGTCCYREIKGRMWSKAYNKILLARDAGFEIVVLRRRLLAPIFSHFGLQVTL